MKGALFEFFLAGLVFCFLLSIPGPGSQCRAPPGQNDVDLLSLAKILLPRAAALAVDKPC